MLYLKGLLLLSIFLGLGVTAGCVRFSGGTWYIKSAATPEGWPQLTPVGKVELREYPVYRAAVVDQTDVNGRGMNPMFWELFQHIKTNDIAMTAPVDMGYEDASPDNARMTSMAFLYRSTQLGNTGEQGPVEVRDVDKQLFASVGVRGGYNDATFENGLDKLAAWLTEHNDEYERTGPPRFLGYNGPMVPIFMRYGEVQMPVRPRDVSPSASSSSDPDPR